MPSELWAARDRDGCAFLHINLPEFDKARGVFVSKDWVCSNALSELCPDLKPGECARVVGIVLEKDGEDGE